MVRSELGNDHRRHHRRLLRPLRHRPRMYQQLHEAPASDGRGVGFCSGGLLVWLDVANPLGIFGSAASGEWKASGAFGAGRLADARPKMRGGWVVRLALVDSVLVVVCCCRASIFARSADSRGATVLTGAAMLESQIGSDRSALRRTRVCAQR